MKPENQDDLKMWEQFRKGNDLALSVIYSENAGPLYQYGLKLTSNRDLIEDSIHDLFLDLIRNRKTIGGTNNIRFYLLKSFRRKLIRLLKHETRYGDNEFSEIMFGARYSAEQDIISTETSQNTSKCLFAAIDKLSPRQKEAIYLKFQKGLDYHEISELLEMGVEASRNLVYRAVKSLKEALIKAGGGPVFIFILKKFPQTD
jgi:RNA polymerase sigma factor (sigma-70 family)